MEGRLHSIGYFIGCMVTVSEPTDRDHTTNGYFVLIYRTIVVHRFQSQMFSRTLNVAEYVHEAFIICLL